MPDRAAPACAAPASAAPASAAGAGRRLPAVLLVVLAALASLLGSPTTAAQAQQASRSVVGGAPVPAARLPLAARHIGSREALPRRASRDRSVVSGALGMVDRVGSAASATAPAGPSPSPSPAIVGAFLVLGLAVFGRVAAAAGDRSAPGRVPSGLRGRAPPAYVIA